MRLVMARPSPIPPEARLRELNVVELTLALAWPEPGRHYAKSYATTPAERAFAAEALPGAPRFDVVSLLHVLDRTARPRTLLARAREHVAEGGRLLVACPLPFRPHVDVGGGGTSDPDEWVEADGTFEQSLTRLIDDLFVPTGLEVERVARTTYLSQGDARAPFYALDDALLVCRVVG